jgi:signal transduction histidine kinase
MATRVRELDWSKTALGPAETWPQSLQTAVSICLASRFPMAICWGPQLVLLYNDAYSTILAAKHPAALGRPCYEVWSELRPIIEPMFDGVLRTGEATWSDDLMLPMARNGYVEEAFFTVSYSAVRDETGGTGGIFVTVTETTDRVVDERRLRLLRDLSYGGGQTRDAVEACTKAGETLSAYPNEISFSLIYLADERGDARLVHQAGAKIPDEARPTLIRASDSGTIWPFAKVAFTATPANAAAVVHPLPLCGSAAWIGGVWPEPIDTAVVLPLARPGQDQPYGFVVAGTSPRRQLDDAYLDFLKLAASHVAGAITNAEAYQQERKRAEALAAIDRAKTTFFSNVSHEFRTPLTLMIGPTEDALATPGRALAGRELEMVHRNELRLLKLVNMLLDFSRVESGRAQAAYTPTDLAAFTTDLTSAFRSMLERAGLRFTVDCPPLPEQVYVDREMWEIIVLNLLSNAFKFTFDGEVAVSLRWLGSEVELTVRDTGIGIAAADLPQLFQRFHRVQTPRARSHEGSGIGLALVQELARLHAGTIAVESEPGKGSAFHVRIRTGRAHLPAERIAEQAPESSQTRTRTFIAEALRWLPDDGAEPTTPLPEAIGPEAGEASAESERILVVDDNADMRAYLERLLGPRWQVEVAADGDAALAAVEARPFDLVLTDVMMPGLDGFALLERLRANPRTREIPVVMLSARAGEVARIEGLESGADDYLIKPFGARELIARVRSQLALRKSRQALVRYRAELYDIFHQAPAPFCVLKGPELVYEMANPAYLRLFGRPHMIGQPLLEVVPELRGRGFDEVLRRVMRTGVPHISKETRAVLSRTGPDEERYWTFIYSPLRGESGGTDRVIVFAWEVTDQVQARQTLEKARRQAEEASMAKDQFLAMLGHELRNPLSPILTALQLMHLRGLRSREQEVIERQVGHLVRLVDDLLDVARITRGKVELRREPIEIAAVVVRGIEMATPLLEQRRHHLEVNVPPDGLLVDGDQDRLGQVVSNLLTNAAKYSEPGSRIFISAERMQAPEKREDDAELVRLTIRDEGIGIQPEMLESIFESFVQHRQALDRASGGLGLGLAIVRSLVRMHGGTVTAHSLGPGKGSEFRIELPRFCHPNDAITVVDATEDSGPIHITPSPDLRPSNRVLVVDDNRDGAEVLAETLRELGYLVEIAHDGSSAIETAKRFRPHIALLDIGLPRMDGYELATRLRELSELESGIRLVAVTGYGQEADRIRSARAGFSAHLVKPVDLDVLTSVVR